MAIYAIHCFLFFISSIFSVVQKLRSRASTPNDDGCLFLLAFIIPAGGWLPLAKTLYLPSHSLNDFIIS